MSPSSRWALLACSALIGGCAGQLDSQHALEQARQRYHAVEKDPLVMQAAPKDLMRAGDSLARAEQLAGYLGSGADVVHFAYLSERYGDIARAHADLAANQARIDRLELERQRLQLALREAALMRQQPDQAADQLVTLAAEETDRGLVMTLGDVLFDSASADLRPSANRTILLLARFLQANPRRVIRIEGYTDSRGDEQMNLALSRARAEAVAQLIEDLGVEASRISVQGYGAAYPLADNASSLGRAQNRRVEIVISDQNGKLSER
jgi:outer membrane protein OmpA-like peptidoglycan-associated protein